MNSNYSFLKTGQVLTLEKLYENGYSVPKTPHKLHFNRKLALITQSKSGGHHHLDQFSVTSTSTSNSNQRKLHTESVAEHNFSVPQLAKTQSLSLLNNKSNDNIIINHQMKLRTNRERMNLAQMTQVAQDYVKKGGEKRALSLNLKQEIDNLKLQVQLERQLLVKTIETVDRYHTDIVQTDEHTQRLREQAMTLEKSKESVLLDNKRLNNACAEYTERNNFILSIIQQEKELISQLQEFAKDQRSQGQKQRRGNIAMKNQFMLQQKKIANCISKKISLENQTMTTSIQTEQIVRKYPPISE